MTQGTLDYLMWHHFGRVGENITFHDVKMQCFMALADGGAQSRPGSRFLRVLRTPPERNEFGAFYRLVHPANRPKHQQRNGPKQTTERVDSQSARAQHDGSSEPSR